MLLLMTEEIPEDLSPCDCVVTSRGRLFQRSEDGAAEWLQQGEERSFFFQHPWKKGRPFFFFEHFPTCFISLC